MFIFFLLFRFSKLLFGIFPYRFTSDEPVLKFYIKFSWIFDSNIFVGYDSLMVFVDFTHRVLTPPLPISAAKAGRNHLNE